LELFLGASHWLDVIDPPIQEHLGKISDAVLAMIQSFPSEDGEESVVPAEEKKAIIATRHVVEAPSPKVESSVATQMDKHTAEKAKKKNPAPLVVIALFIIGALAYFLLPKSTVENPVTKNPAPEKTALEEEEVLGAEKQEKNKVKMRGETIAKKTMPVLTNVLFEDSFELPVVEGFAMKSYPKMNWVPAKKGYNATNHGYVNEGDESKFSTPFGEQGYLLDYTNAGLTTDKGVIPGLLSPKTVYEVIFNVALWKGHQHRQSRHLVELVALNSDDARDDCRQDSERPGVVLARSSEPVHLSDMSEGGHIKFIAKEGDPNLGKEVALRIVKNYGSIIYDDIRIAIYPEGSEAPKNSSK
jgi:hypothetical protein